MTRRTDQVAASIHRAVQTLLGRGLGDPRVRGLVSVTRVTVDDDLARASVFVSVLPAERGPLTVDGLRAAAARIRSKMGQAVRLRRVPRLSFFLDESIKKQAELEERLAEPWQEELTS